MSSGISNIAKLLKDNNQITLEKLAEDLYTHTNTETSPPSKFDIRQNYYLSS